LRFENLNEKKKFKNQKSLKTFYQIEESVNEKIKNEIEKEKETFDLKKK
jgi:hypothetical protein